MINYSLVLFAFCILSGSVLAGVDPKPPDPNLPIPDIDLSQVAEIDWPSHNALYPVTNGTFKGLSLYRKRYKKHQASPSYGVAEFQVTKAGYVYIRCDMFRNNYSGGAWRKEVWEVKDFAKNGWEQIGTIGTLNNGQPAWRFFKRNCKAGEHHKIRVWKYQPVDVYASSKGGGGESNSYTWTGEIPFQKWLQFHHKVLAPMQSAEESSISVTIEFVPKEGQEERLVSEINAGLQELDLKGQVGEK